jgi:hypothetical protein
LNSVQSLGDTPGWEEYSIHMSASDGPLSLQLAIQVKYDSYNIQQGLESVTDHILCQLQGYLAVQWMHSAVAALWQEARQVLWHFCYCWPRSSQWAPLRTKAASHFFMKDL